MFKFRFLGLAWIVFVFYLFFSQIGLPYCEVEKILNFEVAINGFLIVGVIPFILGWLAKQEDGEL